ncbi:MAG: PAS domain S-box protein [Phenylobacterium sp.]|jgi:PAS domain S-box-containing protein|uniref:PAS domain S-box protein n=1 Tax=Phenylobacterium sp. TaxID=1871053 RepID=UPI002A363032|nr:PAS domain S-box protein [Phenylobacterium sp.]MDX9996605.1 PAS domain S-box protein [Phenylobacterium sp.]
MSRPLDPERRFELLVNAVSDYAIYMLDPEGRVASWNTGAARINGYAAEEVLGQHVSRFFTLEDRRAQTPERLLAEAAATGSAVGEGWRIRKDGSRLWSHSVLHAVRGESGELIGYSKVTRDMSEQRAAHQALVESERRFRLLVEGVIDYAMYLVDPDGMITNWNKGAERITGYAAGEVVGRHFSLFHAPKDRRAGLPGQALQTALETGRYETEGWRLRKDGGRFWASVVIDAIYDDDGRHVGFAKITRDISERRAAQDALADSEQQFRLLVGGVKDYALYMLDPNGVVSSWNGGAQKIKGYTSEEIVGQHFSRFYTDAERAAGVPFKALSTAAETGRYEAEGWRVRKDGTLFWAHVVVDAIRDDAGRLIGFAKITRDITERRNAQLELQRAHEQLAQAQKMEALGQLTGGVAHDFNNLLMVVSGQAQLLRKKLADDPRALRALDAIEASARRGEDLTRHLLSFSRRQRLQPVPVSLPEHAGSLKELISAGLPSRVTLLIDLPPGLWPVRVDIGELELALLNLAVNARDAMAVGGGSLTLIGENTTLARGGDADELDGEFVALSVSDTGVGIPPDILPKVFDPFFTTKDVDKGTGLGLSQVYGFARQSGGWVKVESELRKGTTFTLYLPRSQSQAGQAETAEQPEPAAASGASVLVVEDNPEVAEVAAGLLEQLGHRCRVVGNTAAALAALGEGETPDLVFTDVVMAGEMDGVALARRLREERPGLPVLLATGYSQAADGLGDEFPILYKPYKLDELARAVSAALADPDGNLVRMHAARVVRRRRDAQRPA